MRLISPERVNETLISIRLIFPNNGKHFLIYHINVRIETNTGNGNLNHCIHYIYLICPSLFDYLANSDMSILFAKSPLHDPIPPPPPPVGIKYI